MQQVCDCYRDVDVYIFCSVYSVNLLFQLFLLPHNCSGSRSCACSCCRSCACCRSHSSPRSRLTSCVSPHTRIYELLHTQNKCSRGFFYSETSNILLRQPGAHDQMNFPALIYRAKHPTTHTHTHTHTQKHTHAHTHKHTQTHSRRGVPVRSSLTKARATFTASQYRNAPHMPTLTCCLVIGPLGCLELNDKENLPYRGQQSLCSISKISSDPRYF